MILTRKVVAGLALCIALTTVATLYYEGIGEAPKIFFGGEDAFLVAPPGGKLVGTDTVPEGLTGPLRSLAAVQGASAEIYVATAVDGRSVMARGVDPVAFLSMEGGELVAGRLPSADNEALAGRGFSRSFDLEPGESIVLPGSLTRTTMRFEIVGVVALDGPADEELLVSLPAARGLAGTPQEEVHLIRVATQNRTEVKALVESVAPTFTYSDVRLSAESFLPGEPVRMDANLTNWGRIEGVKVVQVRQEGVPIAERSYTVPPFATIHVAVSFSVPRTGTFNLTINPTFVVEVGSGNITFVEAPAIVPAGQPFTVRLEDRASQPASGTRVAVAGRTVLADADGAATLVISQPGRHLVRAERNASAGEIAVKDVFVVEPRNTERSFGVLRELTLPATEFGSARPIVGRAELENQGGVAGNVSVPLLVNGTIVGYANASLEPGARNWTSFSFRAPGAGNHSLTLANGSRLARFRVVEGEDPRIEALLRGYDARARSPKFASTSGDTADDYIRKTVGNIGAAVLILSVVSGALASIGSVAVLARHLAERRSSIGVVKALGARDSYVIDVVTWEAARFAGIASALGVLGGLAAAWGIDQLGLVRAFGHAVHPQLSWTTLGLIFLLGTIVLVISARLLVRNMLAAPAEALLRASAADAPLPSLERIVEARR